MGQKPQRWVLQHANSSFRPAICSLMNRGVLTALSVLLPTPAHGSGADLATCPASCCMGWPPGAAGGVESYCVTVFFLPMFGGILSSCPLSKNEITLH